MEKIDSLGQRINQMLIRIGDEKRQVIGDHIQKMKSVMLSEEAMRDFKEMNVTNFINCLKYMPHKTLIYSQLVFLINIEEPEFS